MQVCVPMHTHVKVSNINIFIFGSLFNVLTQCLSTDMSDISVELTGEQTPMLLFLFGTVFEVQAHALIACFYVSIGGVAQAFLPSQDVSLLY